MISGAENKLIGKFKLIRSGGIVVFEEGFEPLSTQIHDSIFRRLESKNSGSFIIDDSGKKYLVGVSEIKLTKGKKGYGFGGTFESIDHKKGNTGESWYVICYRQMSVVIAPIVESIKSIMLTGFAVILVLMIVSYLFGRKIAKPLAALDKAAGKIGKGNFEYRIDMRRNDEFGNLAHSFNSMAGMLQQTTTSVELLESEVKHRKQIEKALRKSEEKFRNLFDNMNSGVAVYKAENNGGDFIFQDFNKAGEQIEKTGKENIIGRSVLEIFPGIKDFGLFDVFQRVWRTGEPEHYPAAMYKDERIAGWRDNFVYKLPSGEIVAIYSDETERKQAEESLLQAFNIINRSQTVVFLWKNAEGWPVEFVSDNVIELFGHTAEEFTSGKVPYRTTVHPDDLERVAQEVATSSEEEDREEFSHDPYRIITKNGEVKWVDDMTSIRRDEKGVITHYEGLVLDISDKKQAETEKARLRSQLQEAQKTKAIANLAGGVAHQFNNALSVITGHTELLEMDYPQDEQIADYAKAMKVSAHRMVHLTSQLLAYGGGGKYNPRPMSLSEFVTNTLPLISHNFDPAVRVETDLQPDVMNVKADRTQMQMVLSALMANSNEAIEPPGRIRISTRNIDLDQGFIEDHPGLKCGPHVYLSIEDDGKGMDEETRERIFEPFFTTHFMGRGLGMASVYGIISNHDGSISVDSEPGKGTAVTIYLPAMSAVSKEQGAKAVRQLEVEPAIGEGTVLVIEDEEPLLKMNKRILERLGYRVLEAMTGEEAVDLARTFDGRIDLALLDIKLPDMSGNQIYPLIMEARPDLKVVVCSGYALDGPAREILDAGAQAFVQKPFLISTLAEKLKEVLGGRRE